MSRSACPRRRRRCRPCAPDRRSRRPCARGGRPSGPGTRQPAAPPPPLPRLAALGGERRVRDRPAVVEAADDVRRPGTRASSMNTSLNIARPVISRSGRTSTPGWRISKREVGDARVLRQIGVGARDQHAEVAQLRGRRPHLLPVDRPTRRRRARPWHCRPARSEPAPGSLNSWHHASCPLRMRSSHVSFCSRLPCARDRRRGEHVAEARRRADRAGLRDLLVDDVGERAAVAARRSSPRGTSAPRSRSARAAPTTRRPSDRDPSSRPTRPAPRSRTCSTVGSLTVAPSCSLIRVTAARARARSDARSRRARRGTPPVAP